MERVFRPAAPLSLERESDWGFQPQLIERFKLSPNQPPVMIVCLPTTSKLNIHCSKLEIRAYRWEAAGDSKTKHQKP